MSVSTDLTLIRDGLHHHHLCPYLKGRECNCGNAAVSAALDRVAKTAWALADALVSMQHAYGGAAATEDAIDAENAADAALDMARAP